MLYLNVFFFLSNLLSKNLNKNVVIYFDRYRAVVGKNNRTLLVSFEKFVLNYGLFLGVFFPECPPEGFLGVKYYKLI